MISDKSYAFNLVTLKYRTKALISRVFQEYVLNLDYLDYDEEKNLRLWRDVKTTNLNKGEHGSLRAYIIFL